MDRFKIFARKRSAVLNVVDGMSYLDAAHVLLTSVESLANAAKKEGDGGESARVFAAILSETQEKMRGGHA
jgi:hypothetical protein